MHHCFSASVFPVQTYPGLYICISASPALGFGEQFMAAAAILFLGFLYITMRTVSTINAPPAILNSGRLCVA